MKNFIQNPNQKIVITFDGNQTLARIYEDNKVVARGISTCAPEDEFDMEAGSKMAITRAVAALPPKELKFRKVYRAPKPGDYVRIIESAYPREFPGDIYKIHSIFPEGNGFTVRHGDHPNHQKLFGVGDYYNNNYEWNHSFDTVNVDILERVY